MEQSVGGTSKQQVNGNGDQKFPSSSTQIELNDDVLIEILLRLPVTSLVLFKSVSKRWLALITDPNFTLLRAQKPNVDHPSGFFLLRYTAVFAYVSYLDVFKLLPLPHVWEPIQMVRNMAIVIVSPYYKVLYPHNEYTSPNTPTHIQIYSSKTGSWSIRVERFLFESFEWFHDIVYWNDAVHWIDYSDEVFHFSLDLEKPRFIEVETPKMLNGKGYLDHIRNEFGGRIITNLPKRCFSWCGLL
ncbi:F-box protein At5g07610-like [Rutidosis leptorrhynchoides]|uniref:F-box protein At5g07610-like n=1 Tax=Rutidosis leptorrhynchoides TaxID=125765 RepID=UPI003A98D889